MANLKEMMDLADGNDELDEGTEMVEQLKAEIDRMFKGIKEITPEEKQIMDSIQETLKEQGLKFSYNSDTPKHVELWFGMENKPFGMDIIIQNGKIIYRLSFPFRVQSNAIPFVAMYMAEFNARKAFSHMNLDFDDGELSMDYTYILENPTRFDKKDFMVYMMSLIHPSLEEYTKMAHMSVGLISGKKRNLYRTLLENAIETFNEEYDYDDVSYGIEGLKLGDDEENAVCKSTGDDSEDEGFLAEIPEEVQHHRRRRSFLEEFIHMKEEKEDAENDKTDKDLADTLSMFAIDGNENTGSENAEVGEDENV